MAVTSILNNKFCLRKAELNFKVLALFRKCLQAAFRYYTLFLIRTSKFYRGSLLLIFGCFSLNLFLILWAVWNDEKSKQEGKALKNNADRLYPCIIWDNSRYNVKRCFCVFTVHKHTLQESVEFQLETFSLFSASAWACS